MQPRPVLSDRLRLIRLEVFLEEEPRWLDLFHHLRGWPEGPSLERALQRITEDPRWSVRHRTLPSEFTWWLQGPQPGASPQLSSHAFLPRPACLIQSLDLHGLFFRFGQRTAWGSTIALDPEQVLQILRCPNLSALRAFHLGRVRALWGWFPQLVRHLLHRNPQLATLRLSNNAIDDRTVAVLLDAEPCSLEHLSLPNNDLTDQSAWLLASAPCLAGLKTLNLHNNCLTPAGIQELRSSPWLEGVRLYTSRQRPPSPEIRDRLARAQAEHARLPAELRALWRGTPQQRAVLRDLALERRLGDLADLLGCAGLRASA